MGLTMIPACCDGKIRNSRAEHSMLRDPELSLVSGSLSGSTVDNDLMRPIRTHRKSGSGVRSLLRTDSDLAETPSDSLTHHSQISPPLSPLQILSPHPHLSFLPHPLQSTTNNHFHQVYQRWLVPSRLPVSISIYGFVSSYFSIFTSLALDFRVL